MPMEDWFHTLHQELESVERAWPVSDNSQRLQLAEKLLELRLTSDRLVDLWLQFEERLSRVIKQIKAEENGGAADVAAAPPAQAEEEPTALAPDLAEGSDECEHLFRKGEGFYHLRLFHDASRHFADLVERSPDWEIGRLYYAYSLLFSDDREGALREFRLLSRSSGSPKVKAISCNAMGCLMAEEQMWLEAEQAFQAALAAQPDHPEAKYNLALCYLHQGLAKEAMETIDQYLAKAEDDWEAQVIWLRSARQFASLTGRSVLELPIDRRVLDRTPDPLTLKEMAELYEASGHIHRAQQCYRLVTEQQPLAAWGWHGLAWNTWLISGSAAAQPLLKKAVSLAPDNDDFLFGYGWMLLFDGEIKRAMDVFRFILARSPGHRLAQSGLVAAYERAGFYAEARRLAEDFAASGDPYLCSLGHYHLGRLAVAEGDWRAAEQHFLLVSQSEDQFREVPLYLRLCAEKQGRSCDPAEQPLLPF